MLKKDIRQFNRSELEVLLTELGQPRFRAKQICNWLWQRSVTTFDAMTDLSKDLRKLLNEKFEIKPIQLDKSQISSDGTIKMRFRLHDGFLIESVLIPVSEDGRYTACVSSQVGCSLTCKFCATGRMGRIRNLDPAEIYDQVVLVNQQCMERYGEPLTNIVYMGMGEPLLNYQNVLKSVYWITNPDGLGMSSRRLTISTAGIGKMIRKLADDNVKFSLALSLHAADDAKRNEIMPINEHNNLDVLTQALDYFYQKTKNRITFEYIAFRNFNDTLFDAANLAKLCKRIPARVNIIEYNPIDNAPFEKADDFAINRFAKHLREQNIAVTVRKSRGKDIDAACGQLANKR
jgi:23S rRNA (adenine2503-C2)-methyltransferase